MQVPIIETVEVACPRCGVRQPQPRTAYSTFCTACHEHFRVQEALHPAAKPAGRAIERRQVCCFQCGTQVEVPRTAASTMCKRCSSHIDLADYEVTKTVSKSFRTHGRLVVSEKGYLLNTEATVGDAVVKGRVIGRLIARRTLEVYTTAAFKGTFTAGKLIIPAGQRFYWAEPLQVADVEVVGELVAPLCASGTVRLMASARYFGEVQAARLAVEAGAVFVGTARCGPKAGAVVRG